MRRFQTADGYIFYEQPDGTLTDSADPEQADMTFANLTELQADNDVEQLPESSL